MNDDELDREIGVALRALGDAPDDDPAFVDAVMARDTQRHGNAPADRDTGLLRRLGLRPRATAAPDIAATQG